MLKLTSTLSLEQPIMLVKSPAIVDSPLNSDSMIHHKPYPHIPRKIIVSYSKLHERPYGVSSSRRILSPQLLAKKYDLIRDCLEHVLGLTTAEREVVLRLLRYWAYYGYVYPKEATITEQPGCSKATFWRTIRLLKSLGLVMVINRYVICAHAQISNLYRLDRLLILIARYLAEHGTRAWHKSIEPLILMPFAQFIESVLQTSRDKETNAPPWPELLLS